MPLLEISPLLSLFNTQNLMENFIGARQLKDQVTLVSLLSRLGHEPVRKSGGELFYRSMLRSGDTEPSFCVNETLEVWYDHGNGQGGDLIDFARGYWKGLDFPQLLQKIAVICNITIDYQSPNTSERKPRPRLKAIKLPNYKIEEIKPLGSNQVLTNYLMSRGIWGVANEQMKEIYYFVEDEKHIRKHYFAIGWLNQFKGWEMRNKYFKGCLGKKTLTIVPGDQTKLAVFEGYINYLSWKRYHPEATHTVVSLNSLVNLPQAIAFAREFQDISLFLDHDLSGREATAAFKNAIPEAIDASLVYEGFNDYNDKLKCDLKSTGRLPHETGTPLSGGLNKD
jgi:DNA primase